MLFRLCESELRNRSLEVDSCKQLLQRLQQNAAHTFRRESRVTDVSEHNGWYLQVEAHRAWIALFKPVVGNLSSIDLPAAMFIDLPAALAQAAGIVAAGYVLRVAALADDGDVQVCVLLFRHS